MRASTIGDGPHKKMFLPRTPPLTRLSAYFAEKNPAKIHFGDQCAINAVLQDSLVLIAAKWNVFVQSGKEQRDHEKDVVILHFIAADKPWHSWYDHSYGKYYWKYLDASPWRGVKAEQPTSVDQAEKLAMKLCKMGKYRESVVIYQNIVKILKERVRGGGSR